jgi:hypothetical protein
MPNGGSRTFYMHAKGEDAPAVNREVRELIGGVTRRRKKLQRRALQLGRRAYCGRAARYRP